VRARDRMDGGRAVAPLCRAPDAYLVDTTALNLDQVVQRIEELMEIDA
jgi:CMP/dCMP kinase